LPKEELLLQVLETLPSIQLDEEGNLTMRGSGNVEIYINGRPANLSSDEMESILEQYPANAIERVELITNPSARFDAEGTGGIINLILKEQSLQGFNGQINTSAGTGNKYTTGINMNYRSGAVNIFTGYSFQYRELWEENQSFRQYFNPGVSPFLDQDYYTTNWNRGHLIRTALEYEINARNSIRIFGNANLRSRDRERTYNIRNLDQMMQLDSMYIRILQEDQSRNNFEAGMNYTWQSGQNEGMRLDGSFNWSIDNQDRIEYFDQQYFDSQLQLVPGLQQFQTYERPRSRRFIQASLDFILPVQENFNIEAGLSSSLRFFDLEQIFMEFDFAADDFIMDDLITNVFEYNRDIHSAYLILQNQFGDFSMQSGLRAEYTATSSYQPLQDSTIVNNHFDLFPSVFLNYQLSPNQDVQLNYSRRIRRPWTGALAPFINAQDFFNLRIGNPFLNAAYTNSYELSYLRGWQNYFLSATTYYRHTTDALSRVFDVYDDRFAIVTWINSDIQRNTGLELVNQINFFQNLDATITGNVFHNEITGFDPVWRCFYKFKDKLDTYSYDQLENSWFVQPSAHGKLPGPHCNTTGYNRTCGWSEYWPEKEFHATECNC
jgi:iron complex outermembrane recepter protein